VYSNGEKQQGVGLWAVDYAEEGYHKKRLPNLKIEEKQLINYLMKDEDNGLSFNIDF